MSYCHYSALSSKKKNQSIDICLSVTLYLITLGGILGLAFGIGAILDAMDGLADSLWNMTDDITNRVLDDMIDMNFQWYEIHRSEVKGNYSAVQQQCIDMGGDLIQMTLLANQSQFFSPNRREIVEALGGESSAWTGLDLLLGSNWTSTLGRDLDQSDLKFELSTGLSLDKVNGSCFVIANRNLDNSTLSTDNLTLNAENITLGADNFTLAADNATLSAENFLLSACEEEGAIERYGLCEIRMTIL